MIRTFFALSLLLFNSINAQSIEEESKKIKEIYSYALSDQTAYHWLDHLCNNIGPRLAGSENADKAAFWAKSVFESMDLDSVWLQEVDVPNWVRGLEEARIVEKGQNQELAITALGGSVPTPKKGIKAEIIEVQNFDELTVLGRKNIEGKIVFFNRPMDPTNINTGFSYGGAVNQRWAGATEASKFGALAVIVRSMTLKPDNYPHTGSMSYTGADIKIPAVAISIEGAETLHEKLASKSKFEVELLVTCQDLGRTTGYNVIGELKGKDKPDEIVVVGGHLDSWDLGQGAQDDGSGSVQSMEVLHLFKKIGYQPSRTHRVVLFMNEEFGLDGALKYAESVKEKDEYHVIALESDGGSGTPRGFSVDASDNGVEGVWQFKELLAPYGLHEFSKGGSGADISKLKSERTILIGFRPDNQRYFDYHHAYTDRFEVINARELELGAAGMTALLYLLDKYQVTPN